MKAWRIWCARMRGLVGGRRRERDLADELESHLALHIDDNVRAGMAPAEARRIALARLGSLNAVREAHRDQRRVALLDNLVRETRHGLRLLRRTPLFTLVAVSSLGLGIGANAAVFTIANALMMRALPVSEPERLALLTGNSWPYPVFDEIRRSETLFGGVAGWAAETRLVHVDGRGQHDALQFVSGGFFDVLGAAPLLGRTVSGDDDRRGGGPDGPVAVISHAYWQRRFAGDPALLARTVTIDGVAFAVIGVMRDDFFGPEVGRAFDVAIPFGTEPLVRGTESRLDRRSSWWMHVMIRRAPEQSLGDAQQLLRSLQPQVREATMPEHYRPEDRGRYLSEPFTLSDAATGRSPLRTRYERPLAVLAMTAALVLLVTCANLANLLLSRANARRPEMSMRMALGASRAQLVRQVIVEGLLLATAGAIAALVLAWFSSHLIVGLLSTSDAPVHLDIRLDWRVLAFTAAVASLTALLCSAVPALRATDLAPHDAVREQSRRVAGEGRLFAAHALTVTQVALSLALVVVAGLLVRTFTSLSSQALGLDVRPVLVADVTLAKDSVAPDARGMLYARLVQEASSQPGVASATGSSFAPMSGASMNTAVSEIDGRELPGTDVERGVWVNAIGPGFFETYGTPIRAGRGVLPTDDATAPPVVIVNDTFVSRFMGGEDPIGRRISHGGPEGSPKVIVGRVADARYFASLRSEPPPIIYVAQRQLSAPGTSMSIGMRVTGGNPLALERQVTGALERVGPVTVRLRPLARSVHDALVQERLVAAVAGFFGALALLIAGVGLYGVTAYSVSRRRAEIGIRVTLGATPRGIVSLVFSRVAVLVGVGVAAGALLALWLATFVKTLLHDLEPSDPATLVGASATLAAVGVVAALAPAWRAARTDPSIVLRER